MTMTTATDTSTLGRLAARVTESMEGVSRLRAERDREIRRLLGEGMSMYRIAQVTGLTQRAVALIRDDVEGARVEALIEQLESVLHAAGITEIPRFSPWGDAPSRPFFTVLWHSDRPAREMPRWDEAAARVWGIDGDAPVEARQKVHSLYPADTRSWWHVLRDLVREMGRDGHPVEVVEDLGSWWTPRAK